MSMKTHRAFSTFYNAWDVTRQLPISKSKNKTKRKKEVKNYGLQKSKKYDCQKDSRGTRKRNRGRAGKRRQWQYGKNCHPAYNDAGKQTMFNLDLTCDMVLISKAL